MRSTSSWRSLASTFHKFAFWVYIVLEMFGYLLLGWVSARARVFPAWVGWTMLAAGAITLLLGPGYTLILLLFALIGFGVSIVRATQAAAGSPTDETSLDDPAVEPQA